MSNLKPLSNQLFDRFLGVRETTVNLCIRLEYDDYLIQSADFVSPPKWHLAHTTWFFENFILIPSLYQYEPYHPNFGFLFNSYYKTVSGHQLRSQRGFISRPTLKDIFAYRAAVDLKVAELLNSASNQRTLQTIELGIQHEQQHQELLVMDMKHILYSNPLKPALLEPKYPREMKSFKDSDESFVNFYPGLIEIGYDGHDFCFDNERPLHRFYLEPFSISNRLVTNGDYLAFIADGGYDRPELWLSDGWDWIQSEGIAAPLYWETVDDRWLVFGFDGLQPMDSFQPVCHLSYFEADAFARWKGARLPTEQEWEYVARFGKSVSQLSGEVWEWTSSAYAPYPGYMPLAGSLGEYNGKFMCNQYVLRGGSFATPPSHTRITYRNFYPANSRWQFSGLRLARHAEV